MDEKLTLDIMSRFDSLEKQLANLTSKPVAKEWYSTGEAAQTLDRDPWTVREWCRLGRINAQKRACGRGLSFEWIISHEEIQRYRNYGLLPIKK
jgi:hypothetical protein